jgi:hypothetical protein
MENPTPHVRDESYGPHERNVLDLWMTESSKPAPLLVFIHGGAFMGGDKGNAPPTLVTGCLDAGISVASINYRLSDQAPYPAPMRDGARAVQFLRNRAGDWNLDGSRFAAGGGSAGGGISLWIGFHEDLAESSSDDPVMRESTRLVCMVCTGTQSSYDPNFIHSHISGPAYLHEALQKLFRTAPEDFDKPEARRMFADASSINHLSEGDPPVYLGYGTPNLPMTEELSPGEGIHHPRFGELLKEKMDRLGIECVLRYREDFQDLEEARSGFFVEQVAFLSRHFGL